MANIPTILYMNFFALSLLFGMFTALLSNRNMQHKVNVYFLYIILTMLVVDISEMVNYYYGLWDTPTLIHHLASATAYTFRPIVLVIILRNLLRNSKKSKWLWLPVVVLAILVYSSYFTHFVFYFDHRNWFHRGDLGLLPHIISIGYLLLFPIVTIKQHKYISFVEIISTIYIVVLCTFAIIIESLTSYTFILSGAMIVSCSIYYIFMCSQSYKYDSLTGLLNRGSFFTDTHTSMNKPMVVISIDMNGLKKINDTQGHKAGDKALQTLSNALICNIKRPFRAYRTGGDEFFILGKSESEENANKLIQIIKNELKKNNLSASFGCIMFNPDDDFDEVCNCADSKMYEEKRLNKQSRQD